VVKIFFAFIRKIRVNSWLKTSFMKKAPDYIQFYPTLRCNRSCDFCFNKVMPFVPDMPLESFRTMQDRLKGIGVKTIDIIGGESTLHRAIITSIREAEQNGFSVNLSSNGTNTETLSRILETTEKTTVGISINDREALEHLAQFVSKHKPVVKTVFNAGMDRQLVEDILALKPKKFYLLYQDATGANELANTQRFFQFLAEIREKFDPSVVDTVYCSGFLPDTKNHPVLSSVRCPAGTTKLGVLPDGSVYPCNLFFGRPEFCLGNILTDPFETIWCNPALDFFRIFAGNTCPQISCPIHATCHGGCPAHSLIHSGSLSAPEPRCKTE
jgi:radical SAM protein with 4Fe4S-binding SPASM domain